MRVLLVDDNVSFLETLIRYVKTFPSVQIVGKAVSGEEALKQCSRLRPDLILMDIKMPGINGFETTRLIKSGENPPKVVLLSFNDNPEYKIESLKSGADGYLAKSEISSGLLRQITSIFPMNSGAAS